MQNTQDQSVKENGQKQLEYPGMIVLDCIRQFNAMAFDVDQGTWCIECRYVMAPCGSWVMTAYLFCKSLHNLMICFVCVCDKNTLKNLMYLRIYCTNTLLPSICIPMHLCVPLAHAVLWSCKGLSQHPFRRVFCQNQKDLQCKYRRTPHNLHRHLVPAVRVLRQYGAESPDNSNHPGRIQTVYAKSYEIKFSNKKISSNSRNIALTC